MKKAVLLLLVLVATVLISFPAGVNAMIAGELKNLTIVNSFFTTYVMGQANAQGAVPTRGVRDTNASRYLVLIVQANGPTSRETVFAKDFVLKYKVQTGETRASCLGIAPADSSFTPETFFLSEVFNEPGLYIQGPSSNFALLFSVENEVSEVALYRVGTSINITHQLGGQRKYSVYLSSNNSGLDQIKEITEGSGCQIMSSDRLDKQVSGLTIFYAPLAENAARDISQRLMAKFDVNPQLKEMQITTSFDIVVWIGRGCNLKKITF